MLVAVILVVAVVNSYATWLVLHEDAYESTQKIFQVVIIWLVPVLGAIIFAGLIIAERRHDKLRIRRNGDNPVEHGFSPDGFSGNGGDFSGND